MTTKAPVARRGLSQLWVLLVDSLLGCALAVCTGTQFGRNSTMAVVAVTASGALLWQVCLCR